MGYSFIPLSATPYGAVGKPFEDFLALSANASEELGGLNYEQALALLHNNLAMTIQKANVDILLQAQAYSSTIHRPNQPHNGAVAVLQPWMEAAVFKICFEKRSASSAAAGPSVLHR